MSILTLYNNYVIHVIVNTRIIYRTSLSFAMLRLNKYERKKIMERLHETGGKINCLQTTNINENSLFIGLKYINHVNNRYDMDKIRLLFHIFSKSFFKIKEDFAMLARWLLLTTTDPSRFLNTLVFPALY